MKNTLTERGFKLGEFQDLNNSLCSLQDSSNMIPHIWLGISDPIILVDNNTPVGKLERKFKMTTDEKVPFEAPQGALISSRMHLKPIHVESILPSLMRFVETGYSGEPLYFIDSYGAKVTLETVQEEGQKPLLSFGVPKPDFQIMASDARSLGLDTKGATVGWVELQFPKNAEVYSSMLLTKEMIEEMLPSLHYFKDNDELPSIDSKV